MTGRKNVDKTMRKQSEVETVKEGTYEEALYIDIGSATHQQLSNN